MLWLGLKSQRLFGMRAAWRSCSLSLCGVDRVRCSKSPSQCYFLQSESEPSNVTSAAVIKDPFWPLLNPLHFTAALFLNKRGRAPNVLSCFPPDVTWPHLTLLFAASRQPSPHTHIAAPHTLRETFSLSHTLSELCTFSLLSHLLVTF